MFGIVVVDVSFVYVLVSLVVLLVCEFFCCVTFDYFVCLLCAIGFGRFSSLASSMRQYRFDDSTPPMRR